jgi:TRAP-type C4-dicarboxylate transport system permease small subunit
MAFAKVTMSILNRFTAQVYRLLLVFCCLALTMMVIVISAQVFCRFCLNFTPAWSEELTLTTMIYLGFFGAAIAYKKRLHINIKFLIESFSPKNRKRMYLVIDLLLLIFSGYTIFYGIQLTGKTMNQFIPALNIPVGLAYLAIPISGFVFFLFSAEKLLEEILNTNQFASSEG